MGNTLISIIRLLLGSRNPPVTFSFVAQWSLTQAENKKLPVSPDWLVNNEAFKRASRIQHKNDTLKVQKYFNYSYMVLSILYIMQCE